MNLSISPYPTSDLPRTLLLEADPSWERVQGYLPESQGYVAEYEEKIVGVLVLKETGERQMELLNLAVSDDWQGNGIGKLLLEVAIEIAQDADMRVLELGTGAFGHQLTFYQRMGFRVVAVERDYFLDTYPEPVFENGLQHKDRLWLRLELEEA